MPILGSVGIRSVRLAGLVAGLDLIGGEAYICNTMMIRSPIIYIKLVSGFANTRSCLVVLNLDLLRSNAASSVL